MKKDNNLIKIIPDSTQETKKPAIPIAVPASMGEVALSQEFRLLRGLSKTEIADLSGFIEGLACVPHEVQLLEKSQSPSIYFVTQGSLKVAIKNRYQEYDRVFEVVAGQTIHEKALLDSSPLTTIAKPTEPSRIFRLTRESFDKFATKHPAAGHRMIENAAKLTQQQARFPEKVAALHQSLIAATRIDRSSFHKTQLMLSAVKTALCADLAAIVDYQHFKVVCDTESSAKSKQLVEGLLFEQSGFAFETRSANGARAVSDVRSLSGSERALVREFPHALAIALRKPEIHDQVMVILSREPFAATDGPLLEAVSAQILLMLESSRLGEQIDDLVASHAESIQRANQQKAAFASHLSHEIRNPLSSIIGMIEYLNLYKKQDLGEVGPLLQRIDKSARHVLDILNEALDYSKAESGKLVIHREWTNFNDVIKEVREIILGYAQRLNKTDLIIDFGTLYNLPSVYIDYTKIKQVLINLLTNAVKFTARGHIKLYSWIQNNEVIIAIEDTGIGIKESDKGKVFEAFELCEGGTEMNPTGAGLGMSISKNIIELHGGKIWFDSTEGAGSTFFISVPLVPPKEQEVA